MLLYYIDKELVPILKGAYIEEEEQGWRTDYLTSRLTVKLQ